MIPKPLQSLLLLTSLLVVAVPAQSGQEPKPAVAETKPSVQAKPSAKPASKEAEAASKDAKTPAKKTKPSKKALPVAPNYNLNEQPPMNPPPRPPRPKIGKKPKPAKIPYDKRLNLNAASREELLKLPGVTEAYAAKIIAGRPYTSTTGLVLNNVLPTTVYYLIKDQVAAGKVPSKP